MHKLFLPLAALALALPLAAACSSSSDTGSSSGNDAGSATNDDAGTTTEDSGVKSGSDAGKADSGPATGTVSDGIENKSCADACKALSMHCTPTCQFNDSLHGGAVGPYAGAGFYSHTTSDSGGSFTTNAMRFEADCSTVFTSTWTDNPDDPGTAYEVDYTYTSTPISCCCAH